MKAKINSKMVVVLGAAWTFSCGGESAGVETVEFSPNPLTTLVDNSTIASEDPEFTACFIDGRRWNYRFEVMDRQLSENAELRRLAGFSSTEADCDRGYRTIRLKNILAGVRGDDSEDQSGNPGRVSPVGATAVKQPIENGRINEGFFWAVGIGWATSTGFSLGHCSGVTIKDGVALTAAHCVANVSKFSISGVNAGGTLEYCMSSTKDIRRVSGGDPCEGDYALTEKHIHPDFMGDGDVSDDIAVVRRRAGWTYYPYGYPRVAGSLAARRGAGLIMTSFGPTECGPAPRRLFRNEGIFVARAVDEELISFGNNDGRMHTCNGDSGSPLEYTFNGSRRIFGILSGHTEVVDCPGQDFRCSRGVGYATRVGPKADWLQRIIGQCRPWPDNASANSFECWHGPVRTRRTPPPPPPPECRPKCPRGCSCENGLCITSGPGVPRAICGDNGF